jgi:hypothetical protein
MAFQSFRSTRSALNGRCAVALWAVVTGTLNMPRSSAAATPSLRSELKLAETSVQRVLGKAQKVVTQLKLPYRFNAGVCFGVALIRQGDKVQSAYPLERGVEYLFIGGGDSNARNVDVIVLDARGRVLAQDQEADANPVVFFTPKYSGSYQLAVRLKKSKTVSSFCALTVMRKPGGYAVPVESLRKAVKPSQPLPPQFNQVARMLRFHRARNEWAVFGAVLKQGDTVPIPSRKFETGPHIIMAASDGRASRLNLYLINSFGQTVAQAAMPGPNPALGYQTDGHDTYTLAVVNEASRGTSLIFIMMLDVQPEAVPRGATPYGAAPSEP